MEVVLQRTVLYVMRIRAILSDLVWRRLKIRKFKEISIEAVAREE
jgi:hypothetical protein